MGLNYIPGKPYRNRLSLFLNLPATRKTQVDSYLATTPTNSTWSEVQSPTSSVGGTSLPLHPPTRKGSAPAIVPGYSMEMDGGISTSIPLTVNELDAKEKARLLRKHRKLSRVFGEIPDVELRPPSRNRSRTPSHRRSMSTQTSDSDVASFTKAPRKISSFSDLGRSSSDSGSRADVSERDSVVPPVPQLSRGSIDAFSEPGSFQHRKQSSLYISTPPRAFSDDEHALKSPSSLTSSIPSDDVRKHRIKKFRRLLGDGSSPTQTLKTRKSYDSSVSKGLDDAAPGKNLGRSRSLTPHYKKVSEDADNTVDFHRQYIQTHRRVRRQVPEDIHETVETSSPTTTIFDDAQIRDDTKRPSTETRRMSLSSVASYKSPASDVNVPPSPSSMSVHSIDMLSPDSAFDEGFRERRRRVAKLAQFFGVQYQDITATLPSYLAASVQGIVHSQDDGQTEPSVHVDVRTSTKRFWGFNNEHLKEADVSDVIGKLRELKAS